MNMSHRPRSLIAAVPLMCVLTTAGCATKSYVKAQTGIVNARVTQLTTQTNDHFAKQETEISRVNERVSTVDNRVTAVNATAQQALGSAATANQSAAQANTAAAEAMQTAQDNSGKIENNSTEIVKLTNAQNYKLTETANVTFKFNRADLTDEAKAALDLVVRKASSNPRSVLEIEGFTDDVGTKSYNLALSQRRAETVARYLVSQGISLKGVSLIGLGEEQTPEQLKAEVLALDPSADTKDIRSLARRVRIRMYEADTSQTTASAGADQGTVTAQR